MPKSVDQWVKVRYCDDLQIAQLARDALESAGIECFLRDEWFIPTTTSVPTGFEPFAEPWLMVHSDDLERARRILDEMDAAFAHPGHVHILCDAPNYIQELKDLDSLVIDLRQLTFCCMGRGMERRAIIIQMGQPALTENDMGNELRYPDIGSVLYLDEKERLSGILIVMHENPDFPDISAFPGFWDPGSTLKTPGLEELELHFGKAAICKHDGRLIEVTWRLEGADVTAKARNSGKVMYLAVKFDC